MSLSGQGPGRMAFHEDSFDGITKPMMVVTGTRDTGAAGETPAWRLRPYDLSPPGEKYAVLVDGFAHRDFDPPSGDPRGAALRLLQLQFWADTLRGDEAAHAALVRKADASKSTDLVWLRRR
jgi:predicted dienelactone hydrolase